MSQESPRYRCATERAFLPENSEIFFAKFDYRQGVGSRVEQDDEFYYEGEPGAWMDPVNEAARERVEASVDAGDRKSVNAPVSAPNMPLKPPKSGLHASMLAPNKLDDALPSPNVGPREDRPAPRRREKAS